MSSLAPLAPARAAAPAPWLFGDALPAPSGFGQRAFHAVAEAPEGEVVLYGGAVLGAGTGLGDTWTFDGRRWTARCGTGVAGATQPCGPGLRAHAGIAQGPTGVVLFGGLNGMIGVGNAGYGDTWVWDGTSWTQVCTDATCGPDVRILPAMAGNGRRVVLFGGGVNGMGGPEVSDDTWVFDGASWTQVCGTSIADPCGPAPRVSGAMAWDGTRWVLFGGADSLDHDAAPLGDTWTFDGATWTQECGRPTGRRCGPSARAYLAMAHLSNPDPARRGALLAGGGWMGDTSTFRRDAWFWGRSGWSRLDVPWDDTALVMADGEGPPPGSSGLLLPAAAGWSSSCGAVLLGLDLAEGASTRVGGWDRFGFGRADDCTDPAPQRGYRLVDAAGGVFAIGATTFRGSAGVLQLRSPVVDAAVTPSGDGYWLTAADGGVFAFGDAPFEGSAASIGVRSAIVAIAARPGDSGYWLTAADGGVFAFGDAPFEGSAAHLGLHGPIAGVTTTSTGEGYWLAAADGGVFAFGDADFHGSLSGLALDSPIVGIASRPQGDGYWLVAADGGVFAFGDAGFHGSLPSLGMSPTVTGITATATGEGYWLAGDDGGVFAFGDAGFHGEVGSTAGVVGIIAEPDS